MKKLIHPGMIAIIAITALSFLSCSKSTNDLLANDQQAKNGIAPVLAGKKPSMPVHIAEDSITIFNAINQPVDLILGTPASILIGGHLTVFFVKMSEEFAKGSASYAMFSALDNSTGDQIGNYQLISGDEAASYSVVVPAELIGTKFMFAIVDINDEYIGKMIDLRAEITIKYGVYATSAKLFDQALSVVEF